MQCAKYMKIAAWADLFASHAARKRAGLVLLALVMAVGLAGAFAAAKLRSQSVAANATELPVSQTLPISLVAGSPDSLRVPDDVQKALGMRRGGNEQIAVAIRPTRKRPLTMPGSTALDPAGLIRVRVRFAG